MRKKKKSSLKRNFLFILVILTAGYFFTTRVFPLTTEIPDKLDVNSLDSWWNNDYSYRQLISVSTSKQQIFELNHAQLVIDGKSNSNASDLKVIGQTDNNFSEISFDLSEANEINSKIKFNKLKDSNIRYYLYYGNNNPQSDKILGVSNIDQEVNADLKKEESPILTLGSFKKWILKEENKVISFRILSKEIIDSSNLIYGVFNDNKDEVLTTEYSDGIIKIQPDKIKTGINKLYVYSNIDGKLIRSNNISFNYSEPLYVTWTIDWEGTIPDYKYLDQMEDISNSFKVPMTHYFNPRIYINTRVTDLQKKYISDWIKKRYQLGDDIGMHMHMQHDQIEEAGIKAKYTALTWDNGASGYDTPSTAYSYDEYLKILNWGRTELKTQLKRFSDFEIPELQGFRAGGWFANLDNLKAIQDAGFSYDTSGRVAFEIGANKMAQPWNLQTTSQPYFISKVNQNLSTEPTLNLKELPNNGADSYWSTDRDLMANFYQNYNSGEILETDKLVVFLSHPDWFYIDNPKLQTLFQELNKYRNDYDLGPVKFVTMREYIEKSAYIKSIDLKKNE